MQSTNSKKVFSNYKKTKSESERRGLVGAGCKQAQVRGGAGGPGLVSVSWISTLARRTESVSGKASSSGAVPDSRISAVKQTSTTHSAGALELQSFHPPALVDLEERGVPSVGANTVNKSSPGATFASEFATISMLSEFSYPQVRKDFSDGLFNLSSKHQVALSDIDLMCNMLLPPWEGQSEAMNRRLSAAQSSLSELMARSKSVVVPPGQFIKHLRTFENWHNILFEISFSNYWKSQKSTCNKKLSWELPSSNHRFPEIVQEKATSNSAINTPIIEAADVQTITDGIQTCSQGSNTECSNVVAGMVTTTVVDDSPVTDVAVSKLESSECGGRLEEIRTCNVLLVDDLDSNNNVSSNLNMSSSLLKDEQCALAPEQPDSIQHRILVCQYCFRVGHNIANCWRKLKLCLICGLQHHISDCPRYVARKRYTEIFCPKLPKLTCSLCKGDHLGRLCPSKGVGLPTICQWCGKMSHLEEVCWIKSCACFLCGSSEHWMRECHKYSQKFMHL